MRLVMLEYNMYLLVFGIFIGMIVTMILIGIFSISKKDNNNDSNDKRTDTNTSERNTDVDISSNNCSRGYRCGDYNVYREPRTEEIIEDLIIFDMLGLL